MTRTSYKPPTQRQFELQAPSVTPCYFDSATTRMSYALLRRWHPSHFDLRLDSASDSSRTFLLSGHGFIDSNYITNAETTKFLIQPNSALYILASSSLPSITREPLLVFTRVHLDETQIKC